MTASLLWPGLHHQVRLGPGCGLVASLSLCRPGGGSVAGEGDVPCMILTWDRKAMAPPLPGSEREWGLLRRRTGKVPLIGLSGGEMDEQADDAWTGGGF